MSLLMRSEPYNRSRILRKLLERLLQLEEFKTSGNELLNAVLTEEKITLTDEEKQKLQENPLEYLLNPKLPTGQTRPHTALATNQESFVNLKSRIAAKLLNDDKVSQITDRSELHEHIEGLINELLAEVDTKLSRTERLQLAETITNDIIGFGPLESLLRDDSIHEILVLGSKNIFITRKGHREKSSQTFDNDDHLLRVLDRMVAPLGKRLDEQNPTASFRLPDGSRAEAVISPIAANGASLTVYKYSRKLLSDEDLLRFGSVPSEVLAFLKACVQADMNILISGMEMSGKTTLLNILSGFIPNYDLITTIEDNLELSLTQPEVMRLQTRLNGRDSKNVISASDLVRQAARMHTRHTIIGELQDPRDLEFIRSPLSWMTTVRSPDIQTAIAFLEMSPDLLKVSRPSKALHNTTANIVDLVVHMEQLKDGSRKITQIAEVVDLQASVLFSFVYLDEDHGRIIGNLARTKMPPSEALFNRLTDYRVDDTLLEQIRKLFK